MKTITVRVDHNLAGKRLDLALVSAALGLSRRRIRSIIDVGGAYVNRRRVRIASRQVHRGDVIRLEFDEHALKKLSRREFEITDDDILYIDDDQIAINKPPGLPSQATRDQSVVHVLPCLEAYLVSKGLSCKKLTLTHRLDKETSGVLLIGRHNTAATHISEQFRDRSISKVYEAIVFGRPDEPRFVVDSYLSDIDKTGNVRSVHAGGKHAKTTFELLRYSAEQNLSLIRCVPETGRSHQIRVHLAGFGLPIVGDKRYGIGRCSLSDDLAKHIVEHHFLHAAAIGFRPFGMTRGIEIIAPRPNNFRKFALLTELADE